MRSSSSSLSPSLGAGAFEEDVFMSFLFGNMFAGYQKSSPWMRLHAGDTSSSVAQLSTRALGLAYFGKMHHQPELAHRAAEVYGKALKNLNQDLQDSEKSWSLSVLKSAITLELYEVR